MVLIEDKALNPSTSESPRLTMFARFLLFGTPALALSVFYSDQTSVEIKKFSPEEAEQFMRNVLR